MPRDTDVFRQATTIATQADKPILVATIHQSSPTGTAILIPDRGLHTDSVTRLNMRHPLAHFLDDPAELMPQSKWCYLARQRMRTSLGGDQVGAAQIFVEVGSADPAKLGSNGHESRLDGWYRDLFESDIALPVEADRIHGCHRLRYRVI